MSKDKEEFEVEVNAGEIHLMHWSHREPQLDFEQWLNCCYEHVFNPQDKKIKDALISLGWLPPKIY